MNHVLETGIFPDDWKKAKVHPICMSYERNIPSNYRRISILPAISRIIERVMHTQLLEYFQPGNILTESQTGFRPNHSTSTALISTVSLRLTNMDAGKLNSSVFTDLKKAFNIVDHNILLRKLCCYGVNVIFSCLNHIWLIEHRDAMWMESYPQNNMYHLAFPRVLYLDHYCL